MKTYFARPKDIKRDWLVIDAKGLPIGRLATRIATLLKGKHKALYTPNMDVGDSVIVINASEVHATGKKEKTKFYYRHTGYPGGIKSISLEKLRATYPERIIENAVKRMLPRGPLGRKMFKKLYVYPGTEHPHQAQEPKAYPVEN